MKKFTLAAVAALSLALPFAANAAKELRVAVNPTFPPFEFVNTQTNEITGFEMELVRAMGKHLGYDVKMLNIGFDGIIPAILAGTADVGASGFSVTEERKKRVLFTAPFYESGLTILVKKTDADKIKSFKDLEGRKVGVQIGTTAATMAKTIKDAKVSTFNNAGEAILDLQVGGTDAVINDRPVTAYILTQQPKIAEATVHLPEMLSADQFAMVVAKDNVKLAKELDDALAALKASGEYQAIYKKWFGDN